jgi:hypothetical protein
LEVLASWLSTLASAPGSASGWIHANASLGLRLFLFALFLLVGDGVIVAVLPTAWEARLGCGVALWGLNHGGFLRS